MLRTIVEEEVYVKELEKLGDCRRLDEALSGLYWGLAKNPGRFPAHPKNPWLQIAKSDGVVTADGHVIPPLRIFFSHTNTHVYLRWVDVLQNGY